MQNTITSRRKWANPQTSQPGSVYRVGCSHRWMYTTTSTCCIATVPPQQWAAPDAHGRAVSQISPERCLAQELFFLPTCRLTDGDDAMHVLRSQTQGPSSSCCSIRVWTDNGCTRTYIYLTPRLGWAAVVSYNACFAHCGEALASPNYGIGVYKRIYVLSNPTQ